MPHRRRRGGPWLGGAVAWAVAIATLAACTAPSPGPAGPTPTPGGVRATGSGSPATAATGDDIAGPVDLGVGRSIYLECHGTGSPTVILLSGFQNAGDVWQVALAHPPAVADGVASFTRVCLYDRPGSYVSSVAQNGTRVVATSDAQITPARGNAVFPTAPPTGAEVVAELHRLLTVAKVPAPYVLAGHSLGGVLSLLYARTYPQDVKALVLVDPPTPNFARWLSPAAYTGNVSALVDPGPSVIPGYVNERYRLDILFDEINAAAPLPRIAVTDLVRTVNAPVPDPVPGGMTAASFEEIQTKGAAAADAYISAIPGAQLYAVPGGTHNLHLERPDLVIDAIRDAVAGTTMTAKALPTTGNASVPIHTPSTR
jgi:pimeloyl-ACP methyl ester carboxylesterase